MIHVFDFIAGETYIAPGMGTWKPPTPVYEVTVHRGILGYGWTLTRDGTIIGQADSWWMRIFYQTRVSALDAAARFAQHDQVRLPV